MDTVREYTYRADFPAPQAPFTRNLWAQEDVPAWFAHLPSVTAAPHGVFLLAAGGSSLSDHVTDVVGGEHPLRTHMWGRTYRSQYSIA